MRNLPYPLLLLVYLAGGCIGDDLLFDAVDPVIRITSSVDTIEIDSSFLFAYDYFDNVCRPAAVQVEWSSSDPAVVAIDPNGLATALKTGQSTVAVTYDTGDRVVEDGLLVQVSQTAVISGPDARNGVIRTTSTYELMGTFAMAETDTGLTLTFEDDYVADTALPGLYLYLTNNPNSVAAALEIGPVTVFSGTHDYVIPDVGLNDYSHLLYYCKPFSVKVGDGEIKDQ